MGSMGWERVAGGSRGWEGYFGVGEGQNEKWIRPGWRQDWLWQLRLNPNPYSYPGQPYMGCSDLY